MMSLSMMGRGAAGAAYHIQEQEQARERAQAGFDQTSYYTHDASDAPGVWYVTAPRSPVMNGAEVDPASWRALSAGYDPSSGASMVRGAGDDHRAGLDLTFSAPKTLALIRAQAGPEMRAAIDAMHDQAVLDALKLVEQKNMIEVRLGAGGAERQQPAGLIAGIFRHQTSRAGDPALHSHVALLNVVGSEDGTFRTMAAERLYKFQRAVGSAYRASLSKAIHEQGWTVRPAGRDQIEIDGVRQDVIEAFSQRSKQIEAAISGDRAGASASEKELIALQTRQAKSELPSPAELQVDWARRFSALGQTNILRDIELAARELAQPAVGADIEQVPAETAVAGSGPVERAASRMFETENVIDEARLLDQANIEASLSGGADPVEIARRIDALKQSSRLIELTKNGELFYTTAEIAQSEAALIESVQGRHDERDWFTRASIDQAIADAPFQMAEEQQVALRQVADRSGVSILEAAAGSGKTTSVAAPLVSAARESGLNLIGLAPSHRARIELQQVGMPAMTTSKFLAALASENPPVIDERTCLVLDEAGMTSTSHLSKIAQVAHEKGAKFILIGDSAQLESVSGGAGLRLVNQVVGRASSLKEIRRQKLDWMREASMQMAEGKTGQGLQQYADRGHVALIDGRDEAIAEAIDSWSAQRAEFGPSILITNKNLDVDRLNLAARDQLRDEGRITGSDQVVQVRDRDGKTAEIKLAEGERIVFRENIEAKKIFNRDAATVLAVRPDHLKVRMSDGRIVEGAPTDFAQQPVHKGRGRPPKLRRPRIEHAYASSTYGQQGATVAASTLYMSGLSTSRGVYVGLTRHREDTRVIVERGQVEARVRADLRRAGEDHRQHLSDDRLLARLSGEAAISTSKVNVTDFLGREGMKLLAARNSNSATLTRDASASFVTGLGGLVRAIGAAIDRGRRTIQTKPALGAIFDRQLIDWLRRSKQTRDREELEQNKTARREWDGPSW